MYVLREKDVPQINQFLGQRSASSNNWRIEALKNVGICFEARQRVSDPRQTLPGGAGSFLKETGSWLSARLNDPTAAILSRYIALRVGDLNYSQNLPFLFFTDLFDWMSDGAIISGEIAARKGLHQQALNLFLIASDLSKHAPPLFTEGFKFLFSRLKQYSGKAKGYGIEEADGAVRDHWIGRRCREPASGLLTKIVPVRECLQ